MFDLWRCVQGILTDIGVPQSYPEGLPHRAIFCSRTLNLRSIQAIGKAVAQAISKLPQSPFEDVVGSIASDPGSLGQNFQEILHNQAVDNFESLDVRGGDTNR